MKIKKKHLTRLYAALMIVSAIVLCYMVVDLYFNLSLPTSYLKVAMVVAAVFYGSMTMYFFSKK